MEDNVSKDKKIISGLILVIFSAVLSRVEPFFQKGIVNLSIGILMILLVAFMLYKLNRVK